MDITKLVRHIQNHTIKNDVPNDLTSLFNLAKDIVKDIVDKNNLVILFKTGDNYCIYHKNEIKKKSIVNKNISDEALQNFNIMYPRWFTLYSFFALHQTMPMDIFTSILQYYVTMKPIQPMFNQIDNHEIDNIFNSLFKTLT
jgi:hypothetical protein